MSAVPEQVSRRYKPWHRTPKETRTHAVVLAAVRTRMGRSLDEWIDLDVPVARRHGRPPADPLIGMQRAAMVLYAQRERLAWPIEQIVAVVAEITHADAATIWRAHRGIAGGGDAPRRKPGQRKPKGTPRHILRRMIIQGPAGTERLAALEQRMDELLPVLYQRR